MKLIAGIPQPEEINFVVDKDKEIMGSYLYDTGEDFEHTITISSARCGHLDTVIRVSSRMYSHGRSTKLTSGLKAIRSFVIERKRISFELGFDALEL